MESAFETITFDIKPADFPLRKRICLGEWVATFAIEAVQRRRKLNAPLAV